MSTGQFHKHQFLYIEENLFTQLKTTYQLDNPDSETLFIENYIKLLKLYGGKIRKATANLSHRHTVSNETLCELASTSAPIITDSMLSGETTEIKDKYSCPTPTLLFAAFIAASGAATLSESARNNRSLTTIFNECVDYLQPIYLTQFKLSA